MSSDPLPKVVENAAGDRLTVTTLQEQDEAARRGYFRRIARDREYRERQANE